MKRTGRAVRLGPTPYGRGVFAKRPFRRSEVIGEIHGMFVAASGYGSSYCMEFSDELTLEPDAPFRFLNHSCQPNCHISARTEWDEDTSASRRVMYVKSLAPIGPGEQLTIDYAWPAAYAIPCACGSPNCRGWIVTPDQLHLLTTPSQPEELS
jgi:hypothetical protein